jgi:hypothetical protein
VIRPCTSKGGFVLELEAAERLDLAAAAGLLAPLEGARVLSDTPVVVVAEVDGVRVSVHPRKLLVLARERAVAERVAEKVYGALVGSAGAMEAPA